MFSTKPAILPLPNSSERGKRPLLFVMAKSAPVPWCLVRVGRGGCYRGSNAVRRRAQPLTQPTVAAQSAQLEAEVGIEVAVDLPRRVTAGGGLMVSAMVTAETKPTELRSAMRPLTESCRLVIESGSYCREPVKMFQGAENQLRAQALPASAANCASVRPPACCRRLVLRV